MEELISAAKAVNLANLKKNIRQFQLLTIIIALSSIIPRDFSEQETYLYLFSLFFIKRDRNLFRKSLHAVCIHSLSYLSWIIIFEKENA